MNRTRRAKYTFGLSLTPDGQCWTLPIIATSEARAWRRLERAIRRYRDHVASVKLLSAVRVW